jgi:hypothetical protein
MLRSPISVLGAGAFAPSPATVDGPLAVGAPARQSAPIALGSIPLPPTNSSVW